MPKFLLALMLAGAALAQSNTPSNPSGTAADAAKKKIRVEGRVIALNGEAVRKATVRLQPAGGIQLVGPGGPGNPQNNQMPSSYSEASDDSGKFVFEDVAPGRYALTSEKTGFVSQRYGARSDSSPGTPLALEAGNELKDVVIQMTPQAVIAGRVTDQDGDPVANISVSVFRYGYSNGKRTLTPGGGPAGPGGRGGPGPGGPGGPGGTVTDDQGNFRIGNLSPGRYYVSADPRANGGPLPLQQDRPGRNGVAPQANNVTTFYPNALDAKSAAPVDVAAGGEIRGIEIRIRKERTYSIRGKAIDTTIGAPAVNAYVLVVPPDSIAVGPMALSNVSRTSADGSFEIRNLLPGVQVIQGSAGGTLTLATGGGAGLMMVRLAPGGPGVETGATGRMEVNVSDSDVTDVVLQLTGGAEIAGSIKMEDGDLKDWLQPSQQSQNAPPGMPPLLGPGTRSIRLSTTEGLSVSAPASQFNTDGTFQLKGVAPSKYFIQVNGLPQGAFVKSMRFGGQDVTRAPLDLTAGGGGSLEVVLSSKAGDVSGVVLNDKNEPVQGVPVTLWPKIPDRGNASNGIKSANTDQNGSFKISGLAPGDYYAAAWDDIPEAGLSQNPDFLAQFAGDDTAVKLAESGHENASVKLITRERIVAAAAKIP